VASVSDERCELGPLASVEVAAQMRQVSPPSFVVMNPARIIFSAKTSSPGIFVLNGLGPAMSKCRMVQLRRQHQGIIPESLRTLRRFQFKQRQRLPALITRDALRSVLGSSALPQESASQPLASRNYSTAE